MSKVIALDYETYYSKDCSVVDLGYDRYCRHPLFDTYMISVCDGKETWAGHPREFNFDSLKGAILLSHNAAFDQEVTIAEMERGSIVMPEIAGWNCTANMASYLWNVRSLADAVRIGLGQAVDKGTRDKAKGKTWDDMVREGWSEEMLKYARLDAQHCWDLWDKHGSKWPDWERRLSALTIDQGRRGVAIDVPRLEEYMATLHRVIFEAQNSLPWIARGRPPASPLGIAEECRAAGIPTPPVKAHDPEAAEEWEDLYAPQYKWVMAIRNLRKAKKALATMETIKLRLRPDNTVAFSLKYFGAHTGRWSGDSGWNLQNQPKAPLWVRPDFSFELDPKRVKQLDESFFNDRPVTDATPIDVRGLIVARPGSKLIISDLAQIEPRVLNWLAGNYGLLDKVTGGMSIYEAFAREQGGWTGGDLKTEDKKRYAMEKVNVLGMGYGAGWEKAIIIGNIYGVNLTEKDEEFSLKASVDGSFHVRTKVDGGWVYSSCPAGANVVCDPTLLPTFGERCVFVEKVSFRGEKSLAVQALYGQQARAFVKNFRDKNPDIVGLWKKLDEMAKEAVGHELVLELPSGRCLTYKNVKVSLRKFTDSDTGEEYERRCITAEVAGKRQMIYGPMLAENLTQAIARDVFSHNWLKCEDANFPSLFTVHDENVVEFSCCPGAADEVQRCMSSTPDWAPGLPVGAETHSADRYQK